MKPHDKKGALTRDLKSLMERGMHVQFDNIGAHMMYRGASRRSSNTSSS